VIRGGRKQYLKDLKIFLEQLLSGMHTSVPADSSEIPRLERDLRHLDRSIAKTEKTLTAYTGEEIAWGPLLSASRPGFVAKVLRRYIQFRVSRSTPLWDLVEQLEASLEQRVRSTVRLIQALNRRRLEDALRRHRAEFITFLKAIRARMGGRQEDRVDTIDCRVLFSAFPVWLVNLSDIHDVLPLKQGLFDLAIIDEATQCDIASCLPVLHRAGRAVVVGDPNQLRHLSFLSTQREKEIVEKCQVPPEQREMCGYREKSILDLVNESIAGQESVVFLDEHFRSAPPIIQFSNETFYANALHIMTEKPCEPSNPLTLRFAGGNRCADGDNPEEASLVVQDVVKQVERERLLSAGLCHSIGILSPFRAQVDCISKQLSRALDPDAFIRHDIMIGTAHTFQGEERDAMFLSLALDSQSPAASLRFLEKRDVFNVAITRARLFQQVYISLNPSRLPAQSLLGSYLRYIEGIKPLRKSAESTALRPSDRFLLEVMQELERRGCQTWPAYSIAGIAMDLVAVRDGQSCAIDLIGFPGDFEAAFSVDRYKMFHRAGLRMVPVPYSRWLGEPQACVAAIERGLAAARENPAGLSKRQASLSKRQASLDESCIGQKQ